MGIYFTSIGAAMFFGPLLCSLFTIFMASLRETPCRVDARIQATRFWVKKYGTVRWLEAASAY